MKTKIFLISGGLSFFSAYAQLSFSFENGLDSCWQQVPEQRWEASADEPLSGRYSLKHVFDNASAGSDQIACSLNGLQPAMGEVQWQFSLRHGYNPSASNYWIFFLMAEKDASWMEAGKENKVMPWDLIMQPTTIFCVCIALPAAKPQKSSTVG